MNRPTTVGVLALGTAAGLLLSLYGPALPELRSRYGIGEGASALVLSAHFLGAMAGIAWWGLERRLASRTWLATGTGLLAAGAAAIAFAPAWPVVLAGAAGLGVGFGVIVVEIDPERVYAGMAPLFADWVRSLEELYEGYSDEQLELILHFMTDAARRQREATARLTSDDDR